jgi:phosphoenolpyruvate-protein kinase (PTS system EI component)
MLELQSEWSRSGHPMIMDRLNDLADIQLRVIRGCSTCRTRMSSLGAIEEPVILVARDLTPTHHGAARP